MFCFASKGNYFALSGLMWLEICRYQGLRPWVADPAPSGLVGFGICLYQGLCPWVALFSKAEVREVVLFSSSHSIATTYYLLKKYVDERELRQVLYDLLDYLEVVGIDQDMVRKGLKSKYKDFEDALQMMGAYSISKLDCIVTRNIKDFKGCEVPVLTPEQLVSEL